MICKRKQSQQNNLGTTDIAMSMSDHLKELKRRAMIVALHYAFWFLIGYFVLGENIIDFILEVGRTQGYTFIAVSPQEVLVQIIKTIGLLAAVFTLPVALTQIILFVKPAVQDLLPMCMIVYAIAWSMVCALMGLVFAYFVLFPFICKYLLGIMGSLYVEASLSVEKYLSLFLTIEISLSLIFQIPLVCVSLTKFGVITPNSLKRFRREVVVVIFAIAAIITPPDVVSQCMVAIPMIGLYQISILVCRFVKSK